MGSDRSTPAVPMMECPGCAELIRTGFSRCPRCGSPFNAPRRPGVPVCQACHGIMREGKKPVPQGMSCLLLIVGVLFCLTFYGALLGVPLVIWALVGSGKKLYFWRCEDCGTTIPREPE